MRNAGIAEILSDGSFSAAVFPIHLRSFSCCVIIDMARGRSFEPVVSRRTSNQKIQLISENMEEKSMAQISKKLYGDFEEIVQAIQEDVVEGSISASYEDGYDAEVRGLRVAFRVFERFSLAGGNRVSLSVLILEREDGYVDVVGITSGGSTGVIKILGFGEEEFLEKFAQILRKISDGTTN